MDNRFAMKSIKYAYKILVLVAVVGAGGFVWHHFTTNKTIEDLLQENEHLKSAINNLSKEDQIGYAKVLSQEEREGQVYTKLLFVETDPEDFTKHLLRKEYEVAGDVVFFDALMITFDNKLVMDGTERAMYLWRRVYGEKQPPEEGFPIETEGQPSPRYAQLCEKLSVEDGQLFWDEIWKLSNNPKRLENLGIKAVLGKAVYRPLKPGLVYIFKVSGTGAINSEFVPDL